MCKDCLPSPVPAGVLVLVFSILAVNGGMAVANLVVLAIIFAVCCFLTFIVGRQPQSKTKLSFKVWRGRGLFNTGTCD